MRRTDQESPALTKKPTSHLTPVNETQAVELITDAFSKWHEAKLVTDRGYGCVVNKSGEDYRLVVIPTVEHGAASFAGNIKKSVQRFMQTHSVYLLDYTSILGEGAQGVVVLAYNLATSEVVAAKICQIGSSDFEIKQVESERLNLNKMGRFIGSCLAEDESFRKGSTRPEITLMTYYPGMNLESYLYHKNTSKNREHVEYCAQKNPINIFKKINLVMQMIEQVSSVHKAKLIHRDIKTENFILNQVDADTLDLTLIDLGDAVPSDELHTDFASTFGYAAPETWALPPEKKPYSKQSDYFSLGVSIAEIMSNENYQRKLREVRQAQAKANHPSELTPHEIYALMADVFFNYSVTNQDELKRVPSDFDFTSLTDFFDEAIYFRVMKHKLHALLLSMTKSEPQQRLPGSNLETEYEELKILYKKCIEMSRAMRTMAKEIIYVFDTLESTTDEQVSYKQAVYKLFMAHLKDMIKGTRSVKDLHSIPPALMAKAADNCITLFSSDRVNSLKRAAANDALPRKMLLSG